MQNLPESVTDHSCYIIQSQMRDRCYIGYTTNFPRRIRQHNGEITGGAKKTSTARPWKPICLIKGFYDNSTALRFEWKLQHCRIKRQKGTPAIFHYLNVLQHVINRGDKTIPWPNLTICWFANNYCIIHPSVTNLYFP